MSDSERDDELENFLRRRSPLHRRLSDFDHAEPSLELDRIVLNRAREAIETPKEPQMFRGSRWAMPAGLAATILIAFTVVLNVEHQPRKVLTAQSQPVAPEAVEQAGSAASSVAAGSAEVVAAAPTALAAPAPRPEEVATPLVASKADVHADAESWLREIARLRAEGKNVDADREVVAFRRAYPSHAGTSVAQPPTR